MNRKKRKILIRSLLSAVLSGIAAVFLSTSGVYSQDSEQGRPSVDIIEQAENLLNENPESVITREVVIGPDSTHRGDIKTVGVSVVIAGSVLGDVLVVDGDLSLRGQTEVMGRVQVVGGKAFSSKLARVKGGFEVYDYRLKVTRKGMKYHLMRRDDGAEGFMKFELRGFKGLSVGPYNRVDGLPLLFRLRLNDAGPGEKWGLSLKGVYRIAAHRWGWDVFWEGRRVWKLSRIGLGYSSRTMTNDSYKMNDFENSIAALLFKEDFRNYYEKRALELWFEFPLVKNVSLGLEFEVGEYTNLQTSANFSLFGWGKEFRSNPPVFNSPVEEGSSNSISLFLTHDTRDNEDSPETGWYNVLTIERAGDPFGGDFTFTRYEADLHRYFHLGYRSHLDLRLFVHYGSDPLPAIRHLTFGGVGALRGYPDSNAGRDRVILGSVDFRYLLSSGIKHSVFYRDGMDLVLFSDVGQATIGPDEIVLNELDADVGIGVIGSGVLSYLGVFVAQSITDTELDPRVTVRITKDY